MADKTLSLEHIIRQIAEGKFTPSDEPKITLAHAIRNVHEAVGVIGTDKYQGSQFKNVRSVTPHISPTQHSQAAETASKMRSNVKEKGSLTLHGKVAEGAPSDMSDSTIGHNSAISTESGKKKVKEESGYAPNHGNAATVAQWPAAESGKKKIKEDAEPQGTVLRRKVKYVARPDDADPKSPNSTLGRTGQIKTKIIDEEKVIKGPTDIVIEPTLRQVSPDGDKLDTKPQRDKLKKIVKEAIKENALTNLATKAGGSMVKKAIPGLGLAYGAADAYSRAKAGDYVGAGMAGLSGIASTVPGIGTAASAALDAANIARDYKAGAFDDQKDTPKPPEPPKPAEPAKPVSNVVNKPKPKPILKPKLTKGLK